MLVHVESSGSLYRSRFVGTVREMCVF